MTLVGTPNDRGNTLLVVGVDGPGASNPVIELDDVQRFNEFTLQLAAGAMDILGSLDGVTFSNPLAVEDKNTANPDVRGVAMATGSIYYLFGNYKALRVRQIGGGAVTGARLICGKTGRD